MHHLISAALAAAAMLGAGDGALTTRSYEASGFHAVDNAGPFNVTIRRGASFAVEGTGEAADLDRITVAVNDGTLRLGMTSDKHVHWDRDHPVPHLTVTLPALDAATLSGAGNVDIDRLEGTAALTLTGAGNIDIAMLATRSLDLKLAGAGNIRAKGGSAGRLSALLKGAGNVDTRAVSAEDARLQLSGTGTMHVRSSGRAEIDASGVGNAHVVGTEDCRISSTGMGRASCTAS